MAIRNVRTKAYGMEQVRKPKAHWAPLHLKKVAESTFGSPASMKAGGLKITRTIA